MDVNEFRIIIILVGFFIILYILISNKNNRKYKVYKTKRHDFEKSITIKTNNKKKSRDKLDISLKTKNTNTYQQKKISLATSKPKQMSLFLDNNEERQFIIIHSVAKNFYNIKDIYNFMDENEIFMNDKGYFNKISSDNHTRCVKYSVINAVSPGLLDVEKTKEYRISGISFFMELPMNINSLNVLNEMINDAKIFSKKYEGKLYNKDKILLDQKIIKNLRNIAKSYNE